MRLVRLLRDPLAWVVVLSTLATIAIAGLVIGTLEPGLDQMISHAKPVEKQAENLGEKLAEPALPEPTPLPAGATFVRPPVARAPVRQAAERFEDEFEPRRARTEDMGRSVRRQIRELEHLRDALLRERRQIDRYARQDDRWDPEGARLRHRRMGELETELGRVERDLRRLERDDDRLD